MKEYDDKLVMKDIVSGTEYTVRHGMDACYGRLPKWELTVFKEDKLIYVAEHTRFYHRDQWFEIKNKIMEQRRMEVKDGVPFDPANIISNLELEKILDTFGKVRELE